MRHRANVLCVDDDIDLLDGLEQHLRRRYNLTKATSGAEGLNHLRNSGPFAVILSDMRMPKMDGATFLAKAREVAPDTVRMLLTGQTDMASAISAVNTGQIFRFLTKPCQSPALLAAFDQAVRQHRLLLAERELLEKTLHGSIQALADVLALTNPTLFGRASRIKRHVSQVAEEIDLQDRWQVEVAAMLSQLGHVTLPPEVVDKVYYGKPLTDKEQKMVDEAPSTTKRLVEHIPRLEPVLEILKTQDTPFKPSGKTRQPPLPARILKAASDYDLLETQGCDAQLALDTMKSREGQYDPYVLEALSRLEGIASQGEQVVKDLPIAALKPGMILMDDVKTRAGSVFVSRGYEVTERFIDRTRNFDSGFIIEPLRVSIKTEAAAEEVPA